MGQFGFNRGEVTQSIARYLSYKGRYAGVIDELISPVLPLATLDSTPYLRLGIPVARMANKASVAANNSWIIARPAPTLVLQIKSVIVMCLAVSQVTLRMLTTTDIAGLGALTTLQFVELAGVDVGAGPVTPGLRPSTVDTAAVIGVGFGQAIARWIHTANTNYQIDFPDPGICLFGNEPAGLPALGICCETVNTTLNASIIGREWPLPG